MRGVMALQDRPAPPELKSVNNGKTKGIALGNAIIASLLRQASGHFCDVGYGTFPGVPQLSFLS